MTKKVDSKVSQEEIDRQLGELGIKVELEGDSPKLDLDPAWEASNSALLPTETLEEVVSCQPRAGSRGS